MCLLRTYHVPGMVLGMQKTAVSKPDGPFLRRAQSQRKDEV